MQGERKSDRAPADDGNGRISGHSHSLKRYGRDLGVPSMKLCKQKCFKGLQQVNPSGNIARIANIAIKRKFSGKECGSQFSDKFFGSIGTLAEAVL